jgi:hypothetical protein
MIINLWLLVTDFDICFKINYLFELNIQLFDLPIFLNKTIFFFIKNNKFYTYSLVFYKLKYKIIF